jgi:hypothetical protein
MRIFSFGSIAFLAIISLPRATLCQEAGDARNGAVYARKVCIECHAISEEQAPSPSSKFPSFTAVANSPGMTETAVIVWLRTPHPTMPNLIIAPRDQRDLGAYIMSLRSSR